MMIDAITDAHCHIYPTAIAAKAVDAVERFYPTLPEQHFDGTVETLLRSGRANRITRFIVHSVATTPHQVSSINRFIAGAVENNGGAFTGLGTAHPDAPDMQADLSELVSLGLCGVKLHPDIQRFAADDPRILPVYAFCEEKGLPVLVHTGDHRYDYSNPPRIARILRAFPRLKFIGAHFGGWSVWDEAARVLSDFPNMMVDSSSSMQFIGEKKTKELIRIWGEDRVMFATDYPLWRPEPEIELLLRLDLTSSAYRKIFRDNCADLFGFCACRS